MRRLTLLKISGERGVAMLMAMVTIFVLALLAGELVYQSGVYSAAVFRQRDQLRTHLLARTGLRLALLQLRAVQKARKKAKDFGLGENSPVVEKIWQTPLILPPPENIPGLAPSDQENIKAFRKSLGLDGTVNVTITGESGRLSLNQIVWPISTGGAESTAAAGSATGGDVIDPNNPFATPSAGSSTSSMSDEQKGKLLEKARSDLAQSIENLLQKKRDDDDVFREKYPNLRGDAIVGNLAAFMDPKTKVDGDNRDKKDYYFSLETPYAPKEAPLVSSSEFHMVKSIDDTIAKLLDENYTVQTTNSLDVNKASMLLIHSLLPELTADALESIEKRRRDDTLGGPFKDEKDFWAFVSTLGSYDELQKNFEQRGLKILGPETSFRAFITVKSGLATLNWVADIGPMPPKLDASAQTAAKGSTGTMASQGATEAGANPENKQAKTGSGQGAQGSDSNDTDSLNVVYLRTD